MKGVRTAVQGVLASTQPFAFRLWWGRWSPARAIGPVGTSRRAHYPDS